MRRNDREITDIAKVLDIIHSCDCCRLGLTDVDGAYIVPLNFGYEYDGDRLTLYFHCAREGRKIDLIPLQRRTAFEMDCKHELTAANVGCGFSFLYQCIMGYGRLDILDDEADRLHGLQKLMEHYSGKGDWDFQPELLQRIHVLRLCVDEWSCKEH